MQKRAEIVYLRSDWLTLVLLTILIGLQATGEMVGCRDLGLQCYCGSVLMFCLQFRRDVTLGNFQVKVQDNRRDFEKKNEPELLKTD